MNINESLKRPDMLFTNGTPEEGPWLNRVQTTLLKNGVPFRVIIGDHDHDKGFDRPALMGGAFILENPDVIEKYAENRRAWHSLGRTNRRRSR